MQIRQQCPATVWSDPIVVWSGVVSCALWRVGTSVAPTWPAAIVWSVRGGLSGGLPAASVALGYIYYDFKVPSRQLFVADFYKL